ncbi:MAG: hypothetical protein NW201_10270 [Gemmatimonadales bacterium]|nr:hypothetical protein [Gemmatimonadales bacterium]
MTLASRLALAVLVAAAAPLAAQEVGKPAPDFTVLSASAAGPGKPVSLADFRGKTLVLAYFYKARTPG